MSFGVVLSSSEATLPEKDSNRQLRGTDTRNCALLTQRHKHDASEE